MNGNVHFQSSTPATDVQYSIVSLLIWINNLCELLKDARGPAEVTYEPAPLNFTNDRLAHAKELPWGLSSISLVELQV